MSFNEYLSQSMDSFYSKVLTEGAIADRIAEFLNLKGMSPEEAAKKIVDFIMNANESDLDKVEKGIEAVGKMTTAAVAEATDMNEGIFDFITKMDAKLKAIILAAIVIAPNLAMAANPITNLKVAKDEAILKMAPQALLNYLKDKKDQIEQETGANVTETRKKLEDFVKDKIKEAGAKADTLGHELGAKAKEKAQEMGSGGKAKAQEMGKTFMGKMKSELEKGRSAPMPKHETPKPDLSNPDNI
jgi:hypothetical protein